MSGLQKTQSKVAIAQRAAVTAVAASMLLVSAASALEISGSAGLSSEHSDNMTKRPDNEQSDLKSTASASVKALHEGESVKLDLNYSADHSTYKDDSFDDETRVTGSGRLVYEQIDQQLIWTLENTRKNVIRNKALNDVEDNREDRSISSIRADIYMRPTTVDTISITPSYTDIRYEDTENQDSERVGGRINWSHAISKVDSFGVQAVYDDVQFDIEQFDYEYYLYTISYQAQLSKLSYSVVAGANESKRTFEDYDGSYLKADAAYQMNGSLFSLALLQELTDTSRGTNNEGVSDNASASALVDVFERQSVELAYENQAICSACNLKLAAMYEDESYEILPRDNDELRLNVDFDYQWTRLMTLSLGTQWQDVGFNNAGVVQSDYEGLSYRAGLQWQLAEKLSAGFHVAYEEREFDFEARDYDELKGGANVTYRFD